MTDAEKDKFTCKKEVYDLLVERKFENLNMDDYFEMGFLVCYKTIKPKDCDGVLDLSNESDRDTLVKYWYDDSQEMNGVDSISIEQVKMDVLEFLNSGRFYVLRNGNGKIVYMAGYNLTENQAKISHIYTPIVERKKDMQQI